MPGFRYPRCALCAIAKPTTRHHAVARMLYPEGDLTGRADDLITVPTCRACNEGLKDDEEYFRLVVSARVESHGHPDAMEVWKRAIKGLAKDEQERFRRAFLSSVTLKQGVTPAGIYIGQVGVIRPEWERIDRVLFGAVRSLFYHERREPLERNAIIAADPLEELQPERLDDSQAGILGRLLAMPATRVGDERFFYRWVCANDLPSFSAWILSYFKGSHFFVRTAAPWALRPREEWPIPMPSRE